MKKSIVLLLLLVLVLGSVSARSRVGSGGLGVNFGEVTGLEFNYFVTEDTRIVASTGVAAFTTDEYDFKLQVTAGGMTEIGDLALRGVDAELPFSVGLDMVYSMVIPYQERELKHNLGLRFLAGIEYQVGLLRFYMNTSPTVYFHINSSKVLTLHGSNTIGAILFFGGGKDTE